ncbi:hypothetical protein BX667DRAFT_468661 [Coemansia mojavensis]|nr:hypothetical protein BX667DRAFT_468661 [Coemansia mojavensis]
MDSKGNAPEYFYRYLVETDIRSLPKQMLVHLRVCVSTQPVNWVKQFVDMQGLEALSECLGFLNHAGTRKGDDITKEIEILKCIKSVVNIECGAQDVLRYPTCVHNLCFSIDAPSLLTRRLISEILTFICYLNVPTGHATVLKGLDKLQKFREMQKRFEPWMRALESAIDGRGRMGSKVGASEELRQLGGTADRDLTDYVLSSLILINAVVGVSDDVEMRMHYRSQLNVAGLSRIIKKLRASFDSPLISLQINKFDKDAEQDHADVLELYNQQIMQDMTDPEEVFQAILAQIDDDDRAQEHFLSILQRLLLLRDDYATDMGGVSSSDSRATKARYYQLLDEITTQVVMDIRNGESLESDYDSDFDSRPARPRNNDAFSSQYGVSVAGIIDKFSNEEQLEEAVREAKDLREQLEKVTRQKNELELEVSLKSEGLVGTLKTKIFALEDLLRMSRHTIEALQTQIKELRDHEQEAASAQSGAELPAGVKKGMVMMDSVMSTPSRLADFASELEKKLGYKKEESEEVAEAPAQEKAAAEAAASAENPAQEVSADTEKTAVPPAPPLPSDMGGSNPPPAPPLPAELSYVPKVKLKALQWDKLNEQVVESSLWSKLEDRAGLKEKEVVDTLHSNGTFSSLEKLFAAKQARSYDVSIMLGMMKKLSFRDIRKALLRMDTSVVSENMLKQLLTYVPTPEERGLLSAYQGRPDRKRLARPERFFLETMKIWRYEQRLRVTTTWAAWPETFRDLQRDIASVMTAAHAVSTSRHFPQVLEVVLSIGNFMNGSGFRGGAFGFKIASLNRLMDTKAEDNKTTLLHFVAATVEENFPSALEFLEELRPVDSGCRVSYTEMGAEMNPNDRFLLTIRRFVVEASEQFESLTSQFTSMEEAFTSAMLLYGEEPRGMAPEEFFGIFKTFTASFNQVHKDNIRERERKRAAEKPASPADDGESAANGGQSANGENGAVDDLLKSLMAGTDLERVEATKRRRRRELMSIRRRSSVRRSIHRTSISIKALQMLRDIKEDGDDADMDPDDERHIPQLPSTNRRSIMRRPPPDRMTTITEDDDRGSDLDITERRAARRRQLLDD